MLTLLGFLTLQLGLIPRNPPVAQSSDITSYPRLSDFKVGQYF